MLEILLFVDIVCVLLVALSVPVFFVRDMRFLASRLLLTGLGGYVGSALGYLAIVLPAKFELIDPHSTPAAKVLWLTMASIAILLGLALGVRLGYRLANQLNRQRGWD